MNTEITHIYADEQYTEQYISCCQECGLQTLGYNDTSVSKSTFYCITCWDQWNTSYDSTIQTEKDEIQYISKYNNRSKKKKEHQLLYFKPTHKSKRKKIISSDLDRHKMQVIVQQYYRIH
eukprot:879202_1